MRGIAWQCLLVTLLGGAARANEFYTQVAGKNAVSDRAPRDKWGNAEGGEYDLGRDGAFKGHTIAVLQLYAGEDEIAYGNLNVGGLLQRLGMPQQQPFDFAAPRAALGEKGFELIHWKGPTAVPSAEELAAKLRHASQLWVISSKSPLLTPAHHQVIKDFFDRGRGLYIWGDNDPYYSDANALSQKIFGTTMSGNLPGNQVVGPQQHGAGPGFIQDHLLTTGIEHLYEGITIATLAPHADLKPLIVGSANNLVAAFYDKGGRRAILDGGFTRLYCQWDTAGSGRYVKNAAAWLSNVEGRRASNATPWYKRRATEVAPVRDLAPIRGLGSNAARSRAAGR